MSYDQQKSPVTQVIHACLVAASIVVMTASCFLFYFLLLKAAENLHNKMTLTTLHAPVLFFDTNPAGRILNRFSKDVGCMDDVLPQLFLQAVIICLSSLSAMLVPAVTNYWIFLVLLPLTVLCTLLPEIRQRTAENRGLEMQPCVLTHHGDIKWIRNSAYVEHERHIYGQTSKVSLDVINNNNNNNKFVNTE